MKRFSTWLLLFCGLLYNLTLILAFLLGFWLTPLIDIYLARYTKPLPPYSEAWLWLDQTFYGKLPDVSTRTHSAIRGLLETLDDPYTTLIEPQPAQQERQRLSGSYGDAGISLWWAPEGGVGISPYPNSPAARAGIQEGDLLLAVDEDPVENTTLEALAWRLQGDVGTEVTLTLQRAQETAPFSVTLTREAVLHPSVTWRVVDIDRGIGYLDLDLFTDQTTVEVLDALAALKDETRTLQGLILDLRGNGGGVIAPLPQTAGLFLPAETVIYYEVRQDYETAVTTTGAARQFDGPLVVLIDGGTASAAEILAASLSENDAAHLVGQPSFGKGSIQALYPLQDGATLHVTNAVWLTPKHNRLDGVGLQPEHIIDTIDGQDAALQAALAYLDEIIP